jgi:hypothetical protein
LRCRFVVAAAAAAAAAAVLLCLLVVHPMPLDDLLRHRIRSNATNFDQPMVATTN